MPEPSPEGSLIPDPDLAGTDPATGGVAVIDREVLAPGAVPSDAVKKKLGLLFWICVGWFGVVILLAALAPLLPIPDPGKSIPCDAKVYPRGCSRLTPGLGHIFGTDGLGRDIFSRVVWGGRVSLTVGFASIVLGVSVGGLIGILAGYFRGRVDAILMSMSDIVLAFPPILLSLALVSFTDQRNVTIVTLGYTGVVASSESASADLTQRVMSG